MITVPVAFQSRIAAIALSSLRKSYDRRYVRSLFDSIAHRYDFLNHFLSLGFDILWRKKAIRLLRNHNPKLILDVATGTADLAIEAANLQPERIVGVDLSTRMLDLARQKIRQRKLDTLISLEEGAAEGLQFKTNSFDAVMVAFGVRNFSSLQQGLAEMYRVVRPRGVVLILEFSQPQQFPVKQLYGLYFRKILPRLGGFISRNREAYDYLPSTVGEFPDGEGFTNALHDAGFSLTEHHPLTFGIASIYLAIK